MSTLTFGWLLALVGLGIAVIGRRLLWLTLGLAGFALGYLVTQYFISGVNPWVSVLAGLVVGIAGGIVATRGVRLVMSAIGAVLLGLTASALASLATSASAVLALAFLVGAVVGWWIVRVGVRAAFTVITAAAGGALVWRGIATALPGWPGWLPAALGVIVFAVGFAAQYGLIGKDDDDR